jgi:hypothetical protein
MAMVVAVTPDVCLTPMGATPVPVPYPIVGMFDNVAIVAMSVRMCGRPTFTTASQVTTVMGDEAGTAGGVMSGVNKSICESVTASSTVKAEGNRVLRHGDVMKMNNGNTLGTVVFMPGLGPAILGAPSELTPDTFYSRAFPGRKQSSLLNFLKDVGGDLKNMAVGLARPVKYHPEFWDKITHESREEAVKDILRETQHNPFESLQAYYDALTSDDPDAFGALVLSQVGFGVVTDRVVGTFAGVEADAAVDANAAAETGRWDVSDRPTQMTAAEPEPAEAPPAATDPGEPLPSTERPTAEAAGTDGVTVTGKGSKVGTAPGTGTPGEVQVFADRAAARKAGSGSQQVAANRFFREAVKNARDFKVTELKGGGKRMEYFVPARNAGYGKQYVQEIDAQGNIIDRYKDTIGPNGLIDRKWNPGDPIQ